jgi:hypothetical protein
VPEDGELVERTVDCLNSRRQSCSGLSFRVSKATTTSLRKSRPKEWEEKFCHALSIKATMLVGLKASFIAVNNYISSRF